MENEENVRDIEQTVNPPIPVKDITILLVDIWKIGVHARKEGSGTKIISACERVEARIQRLGFEVISDIVGQKYDSNRTMKVIEHDGGDENVHISECISPEIRYNGILVREAEVITKGS